MYVVHCSYKNQCASLLLEPLIWGSREVSVQVNIALLRNSGWVCGRVQWDKPWPADIIAQINELIPVLVSGSLRCLVVKHFYFSRKVGWQVVHKYKGSKALSVNHATAFYATSGGVVEPIPAVSCHWVRARVRPGQVSLSQSSHTECWRQTPIHTYGQIIVSLTPNPNFTSGMPTSHRKAPS